MLTFEYIGALLVAAFTIATLVLAFIDGRKAKERPPTFKGDMFPLIEDMEKKVAQSKQSIERCEHYLGQLEHIFGARNVKR